MAETGRLWLYVWDYQRQRYVHTVYAYKEFGIGECGRRQCEVIERDITEERALELMGQMPVGKDETK